MEGLTIPEPAGWEDSLTGLEGPDFWQRLLVAETWGIEVGRHAVREAAQCLRRTSRTSDYCTRIGLTRFGVILTETDEIAAINYVERVREAGPRSMPRGGENLRFSFGWASPKPGEPAEAVVRRADSRLVAELLG